MISIENKSDGLICVSIFGEFTLADFTELENLVNYRAKFSGPVNLLLNLTGMLSVTVDVEWEDMKFIRTHSHQFVQVAVVTDDQWLKWRLLFSQFFNDTEVGVFETEEEAYAWLREGLSLSGQTEPHDGES